MRDKNGDIKSNSDPTINIAVSCYLSNSCYSILLDLIIIILLIGSMLHTPKASGWKYNNKYFGNRSGATGDGNS